MEPKQTNIESNPLFMRKLVFGVSCVLLLGLLAWSYRTDGIVAALLQPGASADQRVESLRTFFQGWGALAPVVYVGFVTIEVVVAPIPGLMLYAPGGLVFGGFWGGLLSLVGNVLGAGIAAEMMRTFRGDRVQRLLSKPKIRALVERLSDAGAWVIFALRVNPLTTSDLVSYAAGLAGIPTWKVMLGTFFGMAPLCFVQAYLANELFRVVPWLIYPLILLCVAYAGIALYVVRRYLWQQPSSDPPTTNR